MLIPSRARRFIALAAILVAVAVAWLFGRPLPDMEQNRQHFAELQRQVAVARETKGARAAERGRAMRLRAMARTANELQRAAYEAEATTVESRLTWGDRTTVRDVVLNRPLVPLSRTADLGGIAPIPPANSDRCTGCHVSIGSPGFEAYPAPFRTHPAFTSYVGASSPHPPSRVSCVACHQGDPHATTFEGAGHATLTDAAEERQRRPWTDIAADHAMLPVGRTEAACVTCHAGELYQPGAPALNEALVTLDRGGCYACHDLPGLAPTVKRGPDLRRVAAKLRPEWVRAWLANPRAIKPATWMPRFWRSETLSPVDVAAIDAVTAYLFATSEPYAPTVGNPSQGDAIRGKAVVESVGCFGCHVTGDAGRDKTSTRRTFGQPLDAIGSKTHTAWLFDWVRDPTRYSPSTRMPNLRLTVDEAADVSAYLMTLTRDVPAVPTIDPADDQRYRAVLGQYGDALTPEGRAEASQLSGAALHERAGSAVIAALGCFNCHEIRGFEERRTTVSMKPRPVWRDADVESVHATGANGGRAPDLGLGTSERGRVALALTAVAGRARTTYSIGMPWHVSRVAGRSIVQERNCVGCHLIEGNGGDFVKLVDEPSLGPPLLTPEGTRVRPEWFRGFLHQPTTIRPWLSVRMPTFNLTDDEVARVGAYFRAIAPPNPLPSASPAGVTAAAGKELFEVLKCQQCHVLAAIPKDQPTANLAPDLRIAHERLQPEWIDAWLQNPSAILPGTRMPSFWPDYPKSFYPQFDRNAAAQVRAIREHVTTLR